MSGVIAKNPFSTPLSGALESSHMSKENSWKGLQLLQELGTHVVPVLYGVDNSEKFQSY